MGGDLCQLVRDEKGHLSSARVGMWLTLLFSLHYIADGGAQPGVLAFLSGVTLGFVGWAAGPRIAQYLLPTLGQVAQGIASAKPPYKGMDQHERDDA